MIPRKLLIHTYSEEDLKEIAVIRRNVIITRFVVIAILMLIALFVFKGCAVANDKIVIKGFSNAQICEAIRKTENSKSHPYGIMTRYKHTSPKQACLNSIKSARLRWNGQGDFIAFLGKTYSPPDINPNWVRLVHYFLNR